MHIMDVPGRGDSDERYRAKITHTEAANLIDLALTEEDGLLEVEGDPNFEVTKNEAKKFIQLTEAVKARIDSDDSVYANYEEFNRLRDLLKHVRDKTMPLILNSGDDELGIELSHALGRMAMHINYLRDKFRHSL